MIKIYSIGFTGKSAEQFFGLLKDSGAKRLVDVRLRRTSQLAAFAKAGSNDSGDLGFFLKKICNMDYLALPALAPEPDMLDAYRASEVSWEQYETRYLALLKERERAGLLKLPKRSLRVSLNNSVLLCSEHEPDRCHRRLAAEYFSQQWSGGGVEVTIEHLR